MIKKSFGILLTSFLIIQNLQAAEAIVISFRAPLLSARTDDSKTLQVLRKGEKIYLAETDLKDPNYPEYLETIDRSGRTAFIKREYLKIIWKDQRENTTAINYTNASTGHDSTDFRPEEPIPSTYPFETREFTRLNVSLAVGSNPKGPYTYSENISEQNFSYETGARFLYQRKADFDQVDRLYFGLFGSVASVTNKVDFTSGGTSKENRSLFRLGPIVSFDFYKTQKHLLNLGTGFSWNHHRSTITVSQTGLGEEERLFTGFSISPFIQSQFAFRNFYPNADFTLGSELSFYLPHTQNAGSDPEFNKYWSSESPNEFQQTLRLQAQFYMGINFKY
ncbi:MAG: hypothetical protein L6Q33_10735 [Bacteriovoracaceae bacterium]|nr:hypothetical protein [Bacteriovoracaceae bacterium]